MRSQPPLKFPRISSAREGRSVLSNIKISVKKTGAVRTPHPDETRHAPCKFHLIEACQAVADHAPRNAYEKTVVSTVLVEYKPYLDDVRKRLDWGHTCVKTYSAQKQDGRADLLMQPVFAHSVGARKQL